MASGSFGAAFSDAFSGSRSGSQRILHVRSVNAPQLSPSIGDATAWTVDVEIVHRPPAAPTADQLAENLLKSHITANLTGVPVEVVASIRRGRLQNLPIGAIFILPRGSGPTQRYPGSPRGYERPRFTVGVQLGADGVRYNEGRVRLEKVNRLLDETNAIANVTIPRPLAGYPVNA